MLSDLRMRHFFYRSLIPDNENPHAYVNEEDFDIQPGESLIVIMKDLSFDRPGNEFLKERQLSVIVTNRNFKKIIVKKNSQLSQLFAVEYIYLKFFFAFIDNLIQLEKQN